MNNPDEPIEPCPTRWHSWVYDDKHGGYCENCGIAYQVIPTETTIEAIKERRQKIGPRPWQEIISNDGLVEVIDSHDKHVIVYVGDMEETDKRDHAEADFISNAPTDITWLIDEIERLKLEIERQYRHAQYARRTSSDLDDM